MIEFNWELPQILNGIKCGFAEKQSTFFLRPHDDIWGDELDNFIGIASNIIDMLPYEQLRWQFLSVCLGSYLLNPPKAPVSFLDWFQSKATVSELVGCDISLEEIKSWHWGRAAFPVLDGYEKGKNDTIYYALVGRSKSRRYPLFPSWVSDVLNSDAQDAVETSAKFARRTSPKSNFFFWPFINPQKPTHDKSLGLPIYLSFLSLVKNSHIPNVIATGEIDSYGVLHPVHGIYEKCNKVFAKKYKKFIYPDDGSCLEKSREKKPIPVHTLYEAECEWGVRKKATLIDDKNKASLVRHAQMICSVVLGSENLPYVLISAYDTKHEDIPMIIKATNEYMVVVDISRLKSPSHLLRNSFESFLGKKVSHCEIEDSDWLFWGIGEQLSQ